MAEAQREAHKMREGMAAWRQAHPEASSEEIQGQLRRRRRALMARLLRILGGQQAAGTPPD